MGILWLIENDWSVSLEILPRWFEILYNNNLYHPFLTEQDVYKSPTEANHLQIGCKWYVFEKVTSLAIMKWLEAFYLTLSSHY